MFPYIHSIFLLPSQFFHLRSPIFPLVDINSSSIHIISASLHSISTTIHISSVSVHEITPFTHYISFSLRYLSPISLISIYSISISICCNSTSIHGIFASVYIISIFVHSISASIHISSPFVYRFSLRSLFCYTCCYVSIGQSITTLLKQSTTQYILHLFLCIFFLLWSIISLKEFFLIPSVSLYQVLIFTLTLIPFLQSIYPIQIIFLAKYLPYLNQSTSSL